MNKDQAKALAAPFPAEEIHWRAGATSGNKTRALALAYIDARAVMDRLDEVMGPENWSDSYEEWAGGKSVKCGICIKVDEEWVCKYDGADNPQFEATKGGFSDAFKRAAVKWGIGRYLYGLPEVWVAAQQRGNTVVLKETPKLPAWALPGGSTQQKEPQQQPEPVKTEQAAEAVVDALDALAAEYDAEINDATRPHLTKMLTLRADIQKAGDIAVRHKNDAITEIFGSTTPTLGQIFNRLYSYFVWMADIGTNKHDAGAEFTNAVTLDRLSRHYRDEEFMLQGGTYEPWKGGGIHNPDAVVGYGVERAAESSDSFVQALRDRFPAQDGDGVNEFHYRNHLKKHFEKERIAMLTWRQLAQFRTHVLNDEPYPEVGSSPKASVIERAAEEVDTEEERQEWRAKCRELLGELDELFHEDIAGGKSSLAVIHQNAPLDTELAYSNIKAVVAALAGQDKSLRSYAAADAILTSTLKSLTA